MIPLAGRRLRALRSDLKRSLLRRIDPDLVVCNKKNVSQLPLQAFLGTDGYVGDGWPESTWNRIGAEDMILIYSTMAHMQMSLLSRKRLSEEIQRLCKNWQDASASG